MMVIWKYPIPHVNSDFSISVPLPFRVVHVGLDELGPALWIRHELPSDADQKVEARFQIIGTGHHHASNLVYWGTYKVGPFVWHIMSDPEEWGR